MIEKVTLYLVEMELVFPFETSFGVEKKKRFVLVEVVEDGISGWGEAPVSFHPLYSYETAGTAWSVLEKSFIPFLFKEKIENPYEFHEKIKKFRGHPMAKASLELALFDLYAKKNKKPLREIYGGTKKEVEAGVSLGIEKDIEILFERISYFLEKNYRRIKLKIKPGWDVEVIEKVREKFPDIALSVDANQAYKENDIEHLKLLDRFNLLMIEQPFPADELELHRRLQEEIETPICLDESVCSLKDMKRAWKMKAMRILNVKPGRVGGACEVLKMHEFALEEKIPLWCGGMLESGIGRAHNLHLATLSSFVLPNDISENKRYYARDITYPLFEITSRGTLMVPEKEGIGVEVDISFLEKITLKKQSFPAKSFT
ncbi:o-succinylbenzoate synthase [bacterium]|nr:MAG: o-succinylbenzoate synthase [bacterium]